MPVIPAMTSRSMRIGALFGFTAVALGAFGSHGLKNIITEEKLLKSWEIAAHYQLMHSSIICMCGAVNASQRTLNLFIGGITLFSGSIYLLVLTRLKILGPVTPIGGLLLLAGWASLGIDFL